MASFGGGNKCATCNKSVYSNEQIQYEKKFYHTTCFVCSICNTVINSTSKAGSMDGKVSHRLCFEKQMKTSGGKYGGEKVVAGGKLNAEATTEPPSPGPSVVKSVSPSPTAKATPASPLGAAKPVPATAEVKPNPSPVGPSIKTSSSAVPTSGPPEPAAFEAKIVIASPETKTESSAQQVDQSASSVVALQQSIQDFLDGIRKSLSHLSPPTLLITFVAGDQPWADSLSNYLSKAGMKVVALPFTTFANFNEQIAAYENPDLVVMVSPQYAKLVETTPGLREAIDSFGRRRLDNLHTLLYEGGFGDTALKVVDGHYLIRSCHALHSADPIVVCEAVVDVLLNPSSRDGLGLLPDLLDLAKDARVNERRVYLEHFTNLQTQEQKFIISYRLRQGLVAAHAANPFQPYYDEPKAASEVVQSAVSRLLSTPQCKTSLFLCKTAADTALTGLALEKILMKQDLQVLSIECADYPEQAAHYCVAQALQKLKLSRRDQTVLSQNQDLIVILFKGYEQIGRYDNLYVKNKLRTWRNVKVLVTSRADCFQHRGYANCFLADPTNPNSESLATSKLAPFSPMEVQAFALTANTRRQRTQSTLASHEALPHPKLQAEQKEFRVFLEERRRVLVDKGILKEALVDNTPIFISYAWAAAGEPRTRQHTYLRRIAQDLSTLGLPTWLDIERMTGDINEQMAGNIQNSHYALVVDTTLYRERSELPTNVQKEYRAIVAKKADGKLGVFALQFNQFNATPSTSPLPFETLDFSDIDNGKVYIRQLNTLIIHLLRLQGQNLDDYQTAIKELDQRLALLPGMHLLVDRGQDDVQAFDIDQRLIGYVKPFALHRLEDPFTSRFDLEQDFNAFLEQPTKTYVTLGLAGSGKSLFTLLTFKKWLQRWHVWRENQGPQPDFLPIYVPLRNYANSKAGSALFSALKDCGLDDEDVENLRSGLGCGQKLLFVLDGYDELGTNVHPNYPAMLANWPTAKLLISSRPEAFEENGRRLFATDPNDSDLSRAQQTFLMHFLSPFSPEEIATYIERFDPEKGAVNLRTLEELPGLMPLLDNPFLLNLTLQALPWLMASRSSTSTQVVKRSDVYNAFIETLFNKEAFKTGEESSQADYHLFAQRLSFALFTSREVSASPAQRAIWRQFFEDFVQSLLREACPLKRSGHEYTFIHKSVFEYFVACHLWAALGNDLETRSKSWSARSLLEERAVVDFLAEFHTSGRPFMFSSELEENKSTTDHSLPLWQLVEASKFNPGGATAAASAATVLNAANVPFTSRDLAGAQLPGADLSYGILAHANFSKACLRGTTLIHSILYEANFTGADLRNVQWGEYPVLSMEVAAIAHHPTEPWLAIAHKNMVVLKQRDTSAVIGQMEGHTGRVTSVAFSSDGNYVVSGSADKTARIFETQSHKALGQPLTGHTACVNSVSFSPDGSSVVSAAGDNSVRLWDTKTQQAIGQPLVGHTSCVNAVGFSPDGAYLASAGADNTLRLWDAKTQQVFGQSIVEPNIVNCVAFSPDSTIVVTGNADYNLRLYEVRTQNPVGEPMAGHMQYVSCVAFSVDGECVVSGSGDKTLRLWDAKTQKKLGQPMAGHTGSIHGVAFNSDATRVVSGAGDNTVRLWDTRAQQALRQSMVGHTSGINAVAMSPDGAYAASAAADFTTRIWDTRTLQPVGQPMPGPTYINAVAFSPDGARLATGNADYSVRLWDTQTLKAIGEPMFCPSYANSVAFSPDGASVVSASACDYTVCLFDTNAQKSLGEPMKGHTSYVNTVAFSPKGDCVVSGSADWTVRIWDPATRKELTALEGHKNGVNTVAVSPDGVFIASGGGSIHLWDLQSRKAVGDPMVGPAGFGIVAFNPDGSSLISGSGDNIVRLWNVKQVKETGHTDGKDMFTWEQQIKSIAFDPSVKPATDAKSGVVEDKLVMGDSSGTVSFWAISREAQPKVRFLGMPKHASMPLLATRTKLANCQMSTMSRRLLEQHGADVSQVTVVDDVKGQIETKASPNTKPEVVDKGTTGPQDQEDISEFLRSIAHGEQWKAQLLIKKFPNLGRSKGSVKDLAGREFQNITGLQYAAWALDWRMWEMLLNSIPREEALKQYNELEEKGTPYGKQFSWQGLIDGYGVYIPLAKEAEAANWSGAARDAASKYWIETIGKLQLDLPIHLVNEYCHNNRRFFPLPDYGSPYQEPRDQQSGGVNWYDARCGTVWAHHWGPTPLDIVQHSPFARVGACEFDKGMIVSLLEFRERQRTELSKKLSQ